MKSTDNFYQISKDVTHAIASIIIDTLSGSGEKHNMCMEDIYALARILAYQVTSESDNRQYEHVVDFLWMSFHIEINHKMLLLDLTESQDVKDVFKKN